MTLPQVTFRDVIDTLSGGTVTWVLTAVAKHMPDWPLTWQKMYEWFRATAQEVANQRSGGTNPIYPALHVPAQPIITEEPQK